MICAGILAGTANAPISYDDGNHLNSKKFPSGWYLDKKGTKCRNYHISPRNRGRTRFGENQAYAKFYLDPAVISEDMEKLRCVWDAESTKQRPHRYDELVSRRKGFEMQRPRVTGRSRHAGRCPNEDAVRLLPILQRLV